MQLQQARRTTTVAPSVSLQWVLGPSPGCRAWPGVPSALRLSLVAQRIRGIEDDGPGRLFFSCHVLVMPGPGSWHRQPDMRAGGLVAGQQSQKDTRECTYDATYEVNWTRWCGRRRACDARPWRAWNKTWKLGHPHRTPWNRLFLFSFVVLLLTNDIRRTAGCQAPS